MLYAFHYLPKFDTLALAHVCLSATSIPEYFHVLTYRDTELEIGYVSVAVRPEYTDPVRSDSAAPIARIQHSFFLLNEELVKLFRKQEEEFTVIYGESPFLHDERTSEPKTLCESLTLMLMYMSRP